MQVEPRQYRGLSNMGAICYINSFIQTLFLTPQFRDRIYSWRYSQKLHPNKEDSILYQLQKLFARLDLGHEASAQDLIKSFQWHGEEAFNQQDAQEFNRILFQALEKSLKGTENQSLLSELFEGELAYYTRCLQCNNDSIREERFQELILAIKNAHEKVYNPSLQLSLQRYVKPQMLDENNLYECNYCQAKVRAQRGVKFIKSPRLLNLVLQRFTFDYQSWVRLKINDKISFPFVLNFNHYFNGYEQIPNKIKEDTSQYFLKEEVEKYVSVKPNTVKKTSKVVSKNGTTATNPSIAGKVKTKPSANTKSFLQEMRKKKMQQLAENEDLIYVSGTASANNPIQQPIIEQKATQKQEISNITNQGLLMPPPPLPLPSFLPPPPPPLLDLIGLPPPTLTQAYNPSSITSNPRQQITMTEQVHQLNSQKQQQLLQKHLKLQQYKSHISQLTKQYLNDGPLVYQLYSILVHSGTAGGGHYYSYIRSEETGKWYQFNDARVSEINVNEIEKTFGGVGHANAYVLGYRLYEEEKYRIEFGIPEYITKAINEDEIRKEQIQRNRIKNIENILILKVYYQLGVKTIQMHKSSKLSLLFQKSLQSFSIKLISDYSQANLNEDASFIKGQNIRIRLFNPVNEIKLHTYGGRQEMSLEELKIRSYQSFVLEVKGDSEEFQQFVDGFMSIRMALWEENLSVASLDEKNLIVHKVSVGREWNIIKMSQALIKKRNEILSINDDRIQIIKRHQNDEFLYHQIVNISDNFEKTLQTMGILQGEIVFVQKHDEKLNWPIQFQNQTHRLTIKVINSINLQNQNVVTDSRITLEELKHRLCAIFCLQFDNTIIRRGNKSGMELKNLSLTLKQNRFISGTTLFLQKGIPAKIGEVRIQLFLATDATVQSYNKLHNFELISDVPIDTNLKASEIKLLFSKILKTTKQLQLKPENFRIRERVNDKIGKIYRQKPMKQQQIIQKRQIAIQLSPDNLQMKDYSIYVRIWNPLNWTLSEKHEFIVNKSTSNYDLSIMIHEWMRKTGQSEIIPIQEMDICRILSIHKFSIIDLVDMEYFGLGGDFCVLGEPLFINSDGLLYVVKRTGVEPRGLTKEEEEIFGGTVKLVNKPLRRTNPKPINGKKEKGISITVVQRSIQQNDPNKQQGQ